MNAAHLPTKVATAPWPLLPTTQPCLLCLARITLPACRACNGSGRVLVPR